jgi:outer membrane protein OmpA-like peptidoglycan-associated protein
MPKIRTRGIEIVGSGIAAGQRPKPVEQANTGAMEGLGQQTYGQSGQLESQSGPATATTAAPAGNQPGAFGFRINFALNSTTIPREAQTYLDAVGGLMTQEPQVALLIKGHTDASGSDTYNQVLSEYRAAAVQDYLVRAYRIDPARVVAQGRGETEPLTENPYDGKNRRVEFERIR